MTIKRDLFRHRSRQAQYLADVFKFGLAGPVNIYLCCRCAKSECILKEMSALETWRESDMNTLHAADGHWVWSPAADNKVSSVQIRFNGLFYDRPVTKVCLLEATLILAVL